MCDFTTARSAALSHLCSKNGPMTDHAAALDADIDFSHIAPPPGAIRVGDWMQWDNGTWCRSFDVLQFGEGRIRVAVEGTQTSDGAVTYEVAVSGATESLTAAEARELAVLLEVAGAELNRLTRQ
jgi:hypothetical protein